MELNRLRAHEIVREKTNLHHRVSLSLFLSLSVILPVNNAKIVNRNESSTLMYADRTSEKKKKKKNYPRTRSRKKRDPFLLHFPSIVKHEQCRDDKKKTTINKTQFPLIDISDPFHSSATRVMRIVPTRQ